MVKVQKRQKIINIKETTSTEKSMEKVKLFGKMEASMKANFLWAGLKV